MTPGTDWSAWDKYLVPTYTRRLAERLYVNRPARRSWYRAIVG